MNEAGLFVGEMTLTESRFPADPAKPCLFMALWMQYLLDNFSSVDQVIESASSLVIDGWGWHFFAADRSGKSASIEFLGGKPIVHTGEAMGFPILCNTQYDQEIERLKLYQGFGGDKLISRDKKEVPRFVQAASMLKAYAPGAKPAEDYAFDILSGLDRGATQWSLVCDLRNQRAWFRTIQSPKIKQVSLSAFDLDCAKPAQCLDIHTDLAGDISKRFQDYSFEANKGLAKRALDAILKISPLFAMLIVPNGGTMEGLIERFASYPEKTKCR